MVSRDEIKNMLEVQQKAYKDAIEIVMIDVTGRLRQLERRNEELIHSLEFTQKEVDTLKLENNTLKEEVAHLKISVKKTDVDDKVNKINERLDYQEDYSRRNNLRFDGLEEKPNETWEQSQELVQRLLRDKLNLGSVHLERAHRVGLRTTSDIARPRTVVARFSNFSDRQMALKNSPKLKNTHIYINEDLCESSVKLRKAQLPEMKKARAEGKIAYFSHTKLIIRERREQRFETPRTDERTSEGQAAHGAAGEVSVGSVAAATADSEHPTEPSERHKEVQQEGAVPRTTRTKKMTKK